MDTSRQSSSEVREHYEELPYPYRDPAQEGAQFHASEGLSPQAYNHYGWAGRRDLRNSKARILIAGDGTGDASVEYAEMLVGGDAEIHAVDISATSIAIAKARLEKRQLAHMVTHHHLSLLDLPQAGLGQFDIIESSGVLHHLDDPDAGLRALSSVMHDDGIMAIMVYAQYGRTAVYMVQEMLRRMMHDGMPRSEKLALARAFLNYVPQSHWLTVKNEEFLEDINWPDGSGIYDLFLHSTDRAYTVPQIFTWVEQAGLQVQSFFSNYTNESLYQPESYNADPALLQALAGKSRAEKLAIGELMHGSMCKHAFYATRQPKEPAAFANDMVVSWGMLQSLYGGVVQSLLGMLAAAPLDQRIALVPRPQASSPPLVLTKRPATEVLLRQIDGQRSIGTITAEVARLTKQSRNDVFKDFALLYGELHARLLVYLRHESVPAYLTAPDMAQRLKAIGLI